MNNRNVIYFVIGSMILLGGQFWLSSRYPKAEPVAEAKVATPSPATAKPVAAPVVATAPGAPAPSANVANSAATHTLSSRELTLTWQVATGALKQAVWRADGTRFFPTAFPGLAATRGAGFETVREERDPSGVSVVFENAAGERLSYLVPDAGHVLKVEAASPSSAALLLVANPGSEEPVKNLGRIFTVTEKSIEAVAWTDMLNDPFFSFLGSKRKVLPPTAERLGLDAGLGKDDKTPQNHYFAALWKLPRPAAADAAGFLLVPQGGASTASLYLGPKQDGPLLAFEKPFTQVIDYGFFGAVAQGLFWILKKIHALVGNWGWAIVIFTIVIRLATWHLNTKQTISMLRMKDFEPHQKALQAKYEKFGNDMQMPIFLALWSMLNAVFELRQAPFFGWITDLSGKDPYYIYPVLMGASMFAQQYVTPAVGDPAQRKMMLVLMPVMMTFMFASSPAGLTIYYFVFNMIGLGQTWWIMRSYQPEPIKL
ncbi:MAG: membrane protein insertase YidC [Acidobacteria bacterium]|nr:membrane protein insertase YidC [Acidobacteriota bacterium]